MLIDIIENYFFDQIRVKINTDFPLILENNQIVINLFR